VGFLLWLFLGRRELGRIFQGGLTSWKVWKEAREWSELLEPVGRVMLMRFKNPKRDEVKDFLVGGCVWEGVGWEWDDAETVSGWITAFCVGTRTRKGSGGREGDWGKRIADNLCGKEKYSVRCHRVSDNTTPRYIPVGRLWNKSVSQSSAENIFELTDWWTD